MKRLVEVLSSIKGRQQVPAGSILSFFVVPFQQLCFSWRWSEFHGAKCFLGGLDNVLINVEQRQCHFILCLGTNLAYQLAWLLKIFSSECINYQAWWFSRVSLIYFVVERGSGVKGGPVRWPWGGRISWNGGHFWRYDRWEDCKGERSWE